MKKKANGNEKQVHQDFFTLQGSNARIKWGHHKAELHLNS